MFSDSVDGAISTATVFSIINTASANSLDPYKYLEHLFQQMPNIHCIKNVAVLDEYLPWSEKMQMKFRIASTEYNEDEKGELQIETA